MTQHSSGWIEKTIRLDPSTYDRYRPTYPPELFDQVFSYARLEPGSHCLEIGIGTGQATLPFLDAGHSVVGLEPAANLATYARAKFDSHEHLSLLTSRFEDVDPTEQFAMIYAATSFHWVRDPQRMTKVLSHLARDGCAAFFWNHPHPLDPVHADLQPVYHRYMPGSSVKAAPAWTEADAEQIATEMRLAGFQDVQTLFFYSRREMTSADYIALLMTYSDHVDLPDDRRVPMMKELAGVIDAHGGSISIEDTIELHLGRK